jgi:hypothetical protein
MRRLLGLLAGLAILALFPLAATVSARVSDEGGGGAVRTVAAGSASGSTSTSDDPTELTGTLSVTGSTATVTASDGVTLSCSIPAGVDLSAFVGQRVTMECDSGAVSEVKNLATGEEIQPGDDNGDDLCATVPSTSSSDDEGDGGDDDQCDAGSGSGDNNPGNDDEGGDDNGGGGDGGGGDD